VQAAILIFLSVWLSSEREPNPPYRVVVEWCEPTDTLFLERLRRDPSLEGFKFETKPGEKGISHIFSSNRELGKLYGVPAKGFLLDILPTLEDQKLDISPRS